MIALNSFSASFAELTGAQLASVIGAREIPVEDIPGPCFLRPFPYDPIFLAE